MRQLLALLALLCVSFPVNAQEPLLINGWNRFVTAQDAAWWETNAARFDESRHDCVLHVLENIDFDLMDRVMVENQKRNYQVIVTVDGARNVVDVLQFFARYGSLKNAQGEPLIHSAVIGWDKVNNLHPDSDLAALASEMQAATAAARSVNAGLPVWLCVSYTTGSELNQWIAAMDGVEYSGIWLWNVWGWQADIKSPLAALKSLNKPVILGGVYGWKYWVSEPRPELIERSARVLPRFWQEARAAGYVGVAFLSSFDASRQFGVSPFIEPEKPPNPLYSALSKLK